MPAIINQYGLQAPNLKGLSDRQYFVNECVLYMSWFRALRKL